MNQKQLTAHLSFMLLALCLSACDLSPSEKAADKLTTSESAEVADHEVTTRVTTALLNNTNLQGLNIKVVTTKGDVALNGVVDTASQVVLAEKIALDMIGAHAVHNHLLVRK